MPTKPIRRAAAVAGGDGGADRRHRDRARPGRWPAGPRRPVHRSGTCCCSRSTACTSRTSPGTSAPPALARLTARDRVPHAARRRSRPTRSPGWSPRSPAANPGPPGSTTTTPSPRRFPAGTTDCAGPVPGAEVDYVESADLDPTSLDAGQGLAGLPGSILSMTGNPQLIDPAALPVDPATCTPILPNQYLKVNTVFEVARQHGLGTAWSDKHPAYEILPARPGPASRTCSPPRSTATPGLPPATTGPRTTGDQAVRRLQGAGGASTRSTATTTAARPSRASRRSSA